MLRSSGGPGRASQTGSSSASTESHAASGSSSSSSSSAVAPMQAPSVRDVLAQLNMRHELARTMHTADARYAHQAQTPMAEHMHGTAEVRGTARRTAQVHTPTDRLQLSAMNRSPADNYMQLERNTGAGMVPVGRFQNPPHLPQSERHIYASGGRGAPSYPAEANHLSSTAPTQRGAFENMRSEMLVQPAAGATPTQAAHLAAFGNILGIAEQRRDPFMAMASAQSIEHGTLAGSTDTVSSVLGSRNPRGGNNPGTMPASGTGAVATFRGVRATLTSGAAASPASERVLANMEDVHTDLMASGYDGQQAQRMADAGLDPRFIAESMATRMRSAATRDPARMMGQLTHNLRPLTSGAMAIEQDE